MSKKRKNQEEPEELISNEGPFIPDDADEKFFSDASNFIDETPYVRPINEKYDKDGLYILQHTIIFHLATLAGYFPDDLYPTAKAKCLQYYNERALITIDVTPETFIKTYSKFIKMDIEDGHRVIIKDKYIRSDFIDTITPFIEQWYPHAILFLQTLNTTPYRLKPVYYYWIYREVRHKFRGSWEDFRMEYCADINEETFRTWIKRYSETQTPDDIKDYIKHYIDFHFSNESDIG